MVASRIILLLFMNIVKSNGKIGGSEFEDLQGNDINIQEYCKDKYCVPKCCQENEILFVNETTQNATCDSYDSKMYKPVTAFSVYNSYSGKKIETKDKIVFVRKTNFDLRTFESQTIHRDNFYITENDRSLRTESFSGNVINTEMKYYCMDQIYNETANKGAKTLMNAAVILNAKLLCEDKLVDWETGKPIDVTNECRNSRCIAKCCSVPKNIFVIKINDNKTKLGCYTWYEIKTKFHILSNRSVNIDFSKIDVYNNDYENGLRKSSSLQHYKFIKNKKTNYRNCMADFVLHYDHKYRFLENSSVLIDRVNYRKRFVVKPVDFNDYCFDHAVKIEDNIVSDPILVIRFREHSGTSARPVEDYTNKAIAMLISCFFIIATLVVYGVIPDLRNINGIIVMAYLATLAATFIFKAYQFLDTTLSMDSCKPLSAFQYYLAISTFFWMNIMSFDIWWSFRGMYKCRRIHRQGEFVKFRWYALYAWGAPLLIAITATVIDYTKLSHIPQLFKPHFEKCFFKDTINDEIWYFMNLPILILLVVNLIFFLMTSFNIWRIKMSMSQFTNEANKYNNNQNRFGLYLKLSMVMGISWIFDAFDLPAWLQTPASYYNALIGVAVFVVFVLKRKILFLLCKRFKIQSPFIENLQRKQSKYSTTTTTGASYDNNPATGELSD